ncbi:MAG TPA: hypothetical protein VL179_09645 [Mycobacterium sp.]|nr:hypothetical protein [Mycobacterium sp.]
MARSASTAAAGNSRSSAEPSQTGSGSTGSWCTEAIAEYGVVATMSTSRCATSRIGAISAAPGSSSPM